VHRAVMVRYARTGRGAGAPWQGGGVWRTERTLIRARTVLESSSGTPLALAGVGFQFEEIEYKCFWHDDEATSSSAHRVLDSVGREGCTRGILLRGRVVADPNCCSGNSQSSIVHTRTIVDPVVKQHILYASLGHKIDFVPLDGIWMRRTRMHYEGTTRSHPVIAVPWISP